MSEILHWLTGNGTYRTLDHCMAGDVLWIKQYILAVVIILVLYIIYAYQNISSYMRFCEDNRIKWDDFKYLTPTALQLLATSAVFVACGCCGYLFIVIKLWLPIYRAAILCHYVLGLLSFLLIYYTFKSDWLYKNMNREYINIQNLVMIKNNLIEIKRKTGELPGGEIVDKEIGKVLNQVEDLKVGKP